MNTLGDWSHLFMGDYYRYFQKTKIASQNQHKFFQKSIYANIVWRQERIIFNV